MSTGITFHVKLKTLKYLSVPPMVQQFDVWQKNKFLYRFQSVFRKNYSTNTCLGHLTEKITIGFEKGLFTGMILID